MDLSWVVISAIGAVQSLFLAILLIGRRDRASGWLAAVLVALAWILAEEMIDLAAWGRHVPWIIGSTMAFELLLGPLLLFFTRSLREPKRTLRRLDRLHFLPFVLAQTVLLPGWLGISSPVAREWVLLVKGPALFFYLLTSWRTLAGANETRTLRYARRALVAFATLGLTTFVLLHLRRLGFSLPVDSDRAAGLGLTLGLHAIALVTFWPRHRAEADAATQRYSTSPLTAIVKDRLCKQLLLHLEKDRPWLDGDLTLAGLAETAGIPRHHLSQVINEELETTFYELMARRRAEEAKRLLLDPAFDDRTVLDLAFDAGFNSKASFHRALRKFTGTTPTALRKEKRVMSSPSSEGDDIPLPTDYAD